MSGSAGVAASLVECFESHSERGEGDRVVVCIDSMDERRGLMWSNHGEDRDAFARLIEHTAALCKANGVRLVVAPLNEG